MNFLTTIKSSPHFLSSEPLHLAKMCVLEETHFSSPLCTSHMMQIQTLCSSHPEYPPKNNISKTKRFVPPSTSTIAILSTCPIYVHNIYYETSCENSQGPCAGEYDIGSLHIWDRWGKYLGSKVPYEMDLREELGIWGGRWEVRSDYSTLVSLS